MGESPALMVLMVLMVRRPKKGSVAAAGAGALPRGNAPRAEVVEQGTCSLAPTVIASFIASGSEATSAAIPPLPA